MLNERSGRITIAILALGGQGGGVLTNWLVHLATSLGWYAQATSIAGVAQRTGATVYYLELLPNLEPHKQPILALSPTPGDVDVVIASELMEAGRAILRGFVTRDRTTLVASTHRVFAISEKSALGDGRANSTKVLQAAKDHARSIVAFDMEAAAHASGSLISAVMFGALAQSRALPFPIDSFERVIAAGTKSPQANLAGFRAGLTGSWTAASARGVPSLQATTAAGKSLHDRVVNGLPQSSHALALEGVRRLMDYQDAAYAILYIERLEKLYRLDPLGICVPDAARHLALWMSYEDAIRVADLKTRRNRFVTIKRELNIETAYPYEITEFLHPRMQEICDILPEWLGRRMLSSRRARRVLNSLFSKGRHVTTNHVGWFVILRMIANLRHRRRATLRFCVEQKRIEAWLASVMRLATIDINAARELIKCQQLIKGYGETFERGLRNFNLIIDRLNSSSGRPPSANTLRSLREAALRDEDGVALAEELRVCIV